MLGTGQQAPDFELEALDGTSHSLARMLARGPVVLAFLKVTCPVCRFALPFLERLAQTPSNSDILFYGISQDGPPATKFFLEEQGIHFPALLDSSEDNYRVSNAYGIRTVPSIFLVEPDGTVSAGFSGFDRAGLEELGDRIGKSPFRQDEEVPDFQPG